MLWRLRYKLSFRDVAELLLQRRYEVTHETIRSWEFRFAPLLADRLRAKRRGRAGVSWYIDETYVKVAGADAISTVPSTAMATSSTSCSASPDGVRAPQAAQATRIGFWAGTTSSESICL